MTQTYTKDDLAKLFKAAQYDVVACKTIASYYTSDGKIEEIAECTIAPRLAKPSLMDQIKGHTYPGLGAIRDADSMDDVDFTAFDDETNTLYVANVIPADSKETLLHSAMQVYRHYSAIEDAEKFCAECGLKKPADIKPAVLIFEGSEQQSQATVAAVLNMLDKMGVKLYIIRKNNQGEFEITLP